MGSDLRQDLLYALRSLRRAPGFATVAILSTSLSVGLTAVVFAAVNAVVLAPLPFDRPHELVQIATDHRDAPRSSGDWVFWNDAEEIARRNRSFQSMGLYGNAVFDLAGDSLAPPEALYGIRVSASLFSTLGVAPALGRNILPAEDQPGQAKVIILSHGLWVRRFAAARDILGRRLKINGQDYEVIGVMPPEFNFPLRRTAVRTPVPYVDFWASMQADRSNPPTGGLSMVARLREGVTLGQAQADIAAIGAALAQEFPSSNRDRSHRLGSLRDRTLRGASNALWLLMAAAAMFLLIGCANVANLLLARGFSRQREIAVRMAAGAGRARIVQQLLTESGVLALLGGAGGFAISALAWTALPALVPASIPRLPAARADWTVLAFALAVAAATGLLFGLAPAIRSASLSPADLAVRSAAAGRHDRLRGLLVVAEVAISLLLVVVGGRFGARFVELVKTDPGFDADRTFAAIVLPARERYPAAEQRALVYRRFLDAVRAIPGVEKAGTVDALPFSGENHGGFVSAHPSAPFEPRNQLLAEINVAGGEYLEAMGVRLLDGRWFRAEEVGASSGTLIVDDTLARRLWPEASAIGRRLCVFCTPEHPDNWKRVVGVVSSMRHSSLEGTAHHNVYLSSGALENAAFLVLRTTRPAAELDREVRHAIAAVDPQQPVLLSGSMRSFVDSSIADRRFAVSLLAATGLLALAMSAVGIYGVAAYVTSRRSQEIGIRMALGATPARVHALVLRQGLATVLAGLAAGAASAAIVLSVLNRTMPGFASPNLAPALVGAVVVLVIAVAATWLPARRAVAIDPAAALRQE